MFIVVCHDGRRIMIQDIFVGILCVIMVAAGVWCWWVDNGGTFKRNEKTTKNETEKVEE